jgi:molecular chaperone DnaK
MAADNMTLGRFRLDGIPPAPRGIPQVEVTFDMDANGILSVTAKDKATGREQKVTITASTNLSKNDIDRMVEEAHKNQSEDQSRKEMVEARNHADSAIYQAEKSLRDFGDKVNESDRSNIDTRINSLKETLKGSDTASIKRETEELMRAVTSIGTSMYNQPGEQSAPPPPTGDSTPEGDGDVVEGEFKDK